MSTARFVGRIVVLVPLLLSGAGAGEKVTERVAAALTARPTDDHYIIWVTFTDKGTHELLRKSVPLSVVSDRSIQRRLHVLLPEKVVDYTDLPVEQQYVQQIASLVQEVRQQSRWFNSVSAVVTKEQIKAVEELPFVEKIDLVSRFRKGPIAEPVTQDAFPRTIQKAAQTDSLTYGPSLNQVAMMNVPAIHNQGNHAEGVIVGVFDNGFRLLTHQAFDSLRGRIIATHDFVDHKTSVIPNNLDPSYGSHGVNTLSTIGGYLPGNLIGPAYGATFILARTENDSSETPIEEDNWVAAIEWADSIGVQVTSTSLGYLGFDAPYTSLTWQDMNGQVAIISRAATMAAQKGIVVCNSAGNEGSNVTHNTLIAPADADSILSVGAVTPSRVRTSFSSIGPTTDIPARIKPDVMAQGSSVYVASSTDTSGYGYAAGTSFSCPLTAGAAALLVKAHPTATPMQIIHAMKMTASQATHPDNYYGWGIVDALAALNSLNSTDTGSGKTLPTSYYVSQNYPNPFNPTTQIEVDLPVSATLRLKIYDILGREVTTLANETRPAGHQVFTWDGTTQQGVKASSGVYYARFEFSDASGNSEWFVRKMVMVR
jgi:serine protease AprX